MRRVYDPTIQVRQMHGVAVKQVYADAIARDAFYFREGLRSMDALLRIMREP